MAQTSSATTSTSTESQRVDALTFIIATYTNYIISQGYNAIINGATPPLSTQTLAQLDTFLQNENYDTTAATVQTLLSDPSVQQMIASIQATSESDRFVEDANSDPTLMQEYLTANGQSPQDDDTLDAVNSFLEENGYNCTADQVAASFVNQQRSRLMAWAGYYSLTVVQAAGSSETISGPSLTVTGVNSISLGSQTISNVTFANGVLTWNDTGGTGTTGTITFGLSNAANQPASTPTGSGSTFSGTISASANNSLGLPAGQSQVSGTATTAPQPNPSNSATNTGGSGGGGGSSSGTDADNQFQQLETWQFWAMQGIQAVIGLTFMKLLEGAAKKLGLISVESTEKFQNALESLKNQINELNNKVSAANNENGENKNDENDEDSSSNKSEAGDPENKGDAGAGGNNDGAGNKADADAPGKNIEGGAPVNQNEPNDNDGASEDDGDSIEDEIKEAENESNSSIKNELNSSFNQLQNRQNSGNENNDNGENNDENDGEGSGNEEDGGAGNGGEVDGGGGGEWDEFSPLFDDIPL